MTRLREIVIGLLLALGAASPCCATTDVRFSFNAGTTPVHGVFSLDCPAGAGPCAIQTLSGFFGATPFTSPLALPSAVPPPDNLLIRPDYHPTINGDDFWTGDIVFILTDDQVLVLKALAVEQDQVTYVNEYLVTDYHAGVPEPADWALMIGGFGLAGAALRRRRAAVAA